MELETKATQNEFGQGFEVKQAFDEFLSGFEAFKQANDERLKGLERRSADVLSEDKVARINTALDEQKQKLDHLMLAASRQTSGRDAGGGARPRRRRPADPGPDSNRDPRGAPCRSE